MIELFKSKEQEKEFISEYANPFRSDKVSMIAMFIMSNSYNSNITYKANVHFENGNSKGEQTITADSFPDLVKKVELFIKSL
jgi:hypothetical protein